MTKDIYISVVLIELAALKSRADREDVLWYISAYGMNRTPLVVAKELDKRARARKWFPLKLLAAALPVGILVSPMMGYCAAMAAIMYLSARR